MSNETNQKLLTNRDIMPAVLTIVLCVMVAGMFLCLLFISEIPPNFEQVIMIIAGAVLTGFSTSISYWMGSSKGSADKNKYLEMTNGR